MSQAQGGGAELRLARLDPKSRTCQVALSPRPRPRPVRAGAGTAVRAHSALRDPDSPLLPGDTRSALSTGRGAGEGSDQAESELEKPPCLRLWRSVFLNRGEQSTVSQTTLSLSCGDLRAISRRVGEATRSLSAARRFPWRQHKGLRCLSTYYAPTPGRHRGANEEGRPRPRGTSPGRGDSATTCWPCSPWLAASPLRGLKPTGD